MGRGVCDLRAHTTPRVSAIEILTTDLGVLYVINWIYLIYGYQLKPGQWGLDRSTLAFILSRFKR